MSMELAVSTEPHLRPMRSAMKPTTGRQHTETRLYRDLMGRTRCCCDRHMAAIDPGILGRWLCHNV